MTRKEYEKKLRLKLDRLNTKQVLTKDDQLRKELLKRELFYLEKLKKCTNSAEKEWK